MTKQDILLHAIRQGREIVFQYKGKRVRGIPLARRYEDGIVLYTIRLLDMRERAREQEQDIDFTTITDLSMGVATTSV